MIKRRVIGPPSPQFAKRCIEEMSRYIDIDCPVPSGTASSDVNPVGAINWNKKTRDERLQEIEKFRKYV